MNFLIVFIISLPFKCLCRPKTTENTLDTSTTMPPTHFALLTKRMIKEILMCELLKMGREKYPPIGPMIGFIDVPDYRKVFTTPSDNVFALKKDAYDMLMSYEKPIVWLHAHTGWVQLKFEPDSRKITIPSGTQLMSSIKDVYIDETSLDTVERQYVE